MKAKVSKNIRTSLIGMGYTVLLTSSIILSVFSVTDSQFWVGVAGNVIGLVGVLKNTFIVITIEEAEDES